MTRIMRFAFICIGLLVHTVLSENLKIEDLCQFIGDDFTPKVFEGQTAVDANEAIHTIFSHSKTNLLNGKYGISSMVYDKIIGTIIQVSEFNPSNIYEKVNKLEILPSSADLKVFGDETKSVVFYCGFTGHAMLCEIFKVTSPDRKHEHLWKVLVYNSGNGLEHHPGYHVGPKEKYSPVVIYEGPPLLVNEAWVEAAMHFGSYEKVIKNFYPRLLGNFDRSNETYDVFIDPQRTGTCSFSSYHAYFTFKLGESEYKKIFAVASSSALKDFVSGRFSDLVSEKYLSKHALFFAFPAILLPFYRFIYQIANMFPFKFLTGPIFLLQCYLNERVTGFLALIPFLSKERREKIRSFNHEKLASYTSALNEIGKFHFLRWNVDLVDTMFRYLVEIGNGHNILSTPRTTSLVKGIFDAVPTHIADNRGIRASFSEPDWKPFSLGYHEKLSTRDMFYCELPNFEYEDGTYDGGNFTEFSNSILRFLANEIAYQPCFMGEKIPLISYLDSVTFRIVKMVDKFDSLDVNKMWFLYEFFAKVLRLLEYEDCRNFIYQKSLILVEIFKIYKRIYTRHLKASLNGDENKFRLLNDSIFEKLSPSFSYYNQIDLLERKLPTDRKIFQFLPEDQELGSKLVSILFKGSQDLPNLDEMRQFFALYRINYEKDDYHGYDPDHYKRMAYILTVILNPLNVKKPSQGVLPKACLLDTYYYNLLHMLHELSHDHLYSYVVSASSSFCFYSSIDTQSHFEVKKTGYSNAKEISSLFWKEKRPLDLMNLNDKFSSIFYFLTYLQEDDAFILSEAGLGILYTYILKPSTYAEDDSEKALPPVIRYFLCRKEKILAEVFINGDNTELFKLLANYQIILNRLMLIQKTDLDIGDLEHVFVGEYQPIFAFLKLNALILGEKLSNLSNSHNFYLSVISNFELISSFFLDEEIQYVLRMYYDHWKFSSSKSRCAAETAKGIQNLVNGNFLVNEEWIQLSGLPFPNHRLWKMMDVKQKRDYKVEAMLHRRQSDGSIFSTIKYNDMPLFLNASDAFLLRNGEIEAKLVSDEFKLFQPELRREVAFNSKMVGSDDDIIAFKTHSNRWIDKVYLFDSDGFEYGEVSGRNSLLLKNSSKFIQELSSPLPCSFRINSFCSFSSASQSLLDALLTRGVLFNFALDSYIFTLESEAQSFYLFDSYNGPAKEFYAIKEGSDQYFAVIKGEKLKMHPPAEIEENFFASSNLPFLFVSAETFFYTVIPVPMSPLGKSYKFTFLKATCKDLKFNIEGYHREVVLSIVYWLVFLRYYDRAMQYVSLYTSISFELTEIELVILQNILEIKYRDLEYVVIEGWANHLLDEHGIFFKRLLNEENRVKKITDIANLISIIPFKYKRLLFSFLPNIGEDKYLWAYSNRLEIGSSDAESSKIQPNITDLKKAIEDADYKLSRNSFSKLKLTHWSKFQYFRFPSGIFFFLYDLAGSCKDLTDFTSRLNSHYLNSIRFYLEIKKDKDDYKIVCLFHVIFMVFNRLPDKEKLATFFAKFKKNTFPYEVLDIYEQSVEFKSFIPYKRLIRITAVLPSPPADYGNLLNITVQRNALSSDLFKANASFTFFSDAASIEQKLKSIVSTDEPLYGLPLGALKDPRLLAQMLLCGSVEELGAFFTVSAEKVPELLDLLLSHFITFFYCKSSFLQKNTFCQAWLEEKEASTQKRRSLVSQPLPVTVQDKVFILIEFFTKYPLYEEQRTIMSTILDKMMHGESYVVQQGMAGGKTTRFGPVAAIVATSILRKLPIFIFPNSILNQNILQLQQWLFDFFGKSVFEFKSERSPYGYSEQYLRYLYYRLTMAHDRGDVFVSSMNSIQCLLNARKELLLQNTQTSKRSLVWILRILHFIEHYSIFVLDEADEIMDASVLYNFDTNEPDEKDWKVIDVLIQCFLFLRHKKVFKSQTGNPITIFEIKEPLTLSAVELFKKILHQELDPILENTSQETRALIVDHLFVNCWERVRNVGYGASMESPFPYPIPYAMANTPREGSSFGNQLFIIAISLKFYLENEMKDLSEPPLFFNEDNMHSILELYYDYETLKQIKRETKSSVLKLFRLLREKIYENDDTLKLFLRNVVIEGINTSPDQIVSSVIEFILSCSQVLAYSGTLYNWMNFEVIPNVDIDVSQSYVIERRIHNSYVSQRQNLGLLDNKNAQVDALVAFILETSTTALFDAGALLKDHSNAKIADHILASKRYKCVVYYDQKENVIVYQTKTGRIGWDLPVEGQFLFLETKYGLKNDEIFLYLDQAHCFGTNVDVNNPSAICVVTFSTLVYTKSFYQTLLRARKLLNGISVDNSFTFFEKPRHQIKIFVSSILKDDQNMLSTLSANDKEELSSKAKFFSDVIKSGKKGALKTIFTSAHLNQLKMDRKERALLRWQVFFSTILKVLWSPTYSSADNQIPNWDRILNLNDGKSIDELKWIFFSQTGISKSEILKFFQASQAGATFFPNFNMSLIPSIADTPALDSETVVQSTQEQQSVQEQEEIDENLEDTNVSPANSSPFGISDAELPNLRVKFTKDFATTVVGRLNLNDTYTKYPVFVDAVGGEWLFATINDVAEKLRDTAHFFFSPALINIYNLEEFDLEDMLHYLAYSGGAIGFMNLLNSCTKANRDLIFGFITAHEPILQQWIYFAIKFKKTSSLRALRPMQSRFKGSTKYNFTNVAIKLGISEGKLRFTMCAKDPKMPVDLDQFSLPLDDLKPSNVFVNETGPVASESLSINVKPENLSITNANLTAEESAYPHPETKVPYEVTIKIPLNNTATNTCTMLKSIVIGGFVLLCIGWSAYFLYSHYCGASKPSSIGISHYFLLISRTAKLTLVAAGVSVSITYGLWVVYQNHANAEKKDSSSRSATFASQDVLTSVEANAIKGGCLPKIDGNSASARHTGLVGILITSIFFLVLELL
ncbi:hypothetical protein MDAP_001373 [Mitosporidium daphniae]